MALKDLARAKGITYGGYPQMPSGVMIGDFVTKPEYAKYRQVFLEEYDLVVVGTFGITVSKEPWKYNFSEIEPLIDWAAQNNLKVRLHPLVWHMYNSGWIQNKIADRSGDLTGAFDQQVTEKVNYVRDRLAVKDKNIHSIDVVNEQASDDQSKPTGQLRDSPWLKSLGYGYIERAFRKAGECDKGAALCYNDYSIELSGSYWDKRWQVCLKIITDLKNAGAPIHTMGFQSHLDASNWQYFKPEVFARRLKQVSDLGLEIYISELDVNDAGLKGNTGSRDKKAGDMVYEYLSTALDNPATSTVISWGVTDKWSWAHENGWYKRDDGDYRALPFDNDFNKKPHYYGIERALKECKPRPGTKQPQQPQPSAAPQPRAQPDESHEGCE